MHREFDFSAYAEKVRSMVAGGLAGEQQATVIAEVTGRVAALAEETLAQRLDAGERSHIACQAGCGTCCLVNVTILFPEAVAIAGYLKRILSGRDLESQRARLDDLYQRSRWLDDEERVFLRRPCAFLDEAAACTIHPVRPLLCRSVTSTDPEACRQAVAMTAFGETQQVLMNLFQKALMDASYSGFGRGLEQLGLDARGVRLTAAVKRLLDEPALATRFTAGARVAL